MVKGLATLVAPKIRVNSVSPGLLETVSNISGCETLNGSLGAKGENHQEWAERFSEEQKAAHLQKTKLKRFVTVEVSFVIPE